MPVSNRGILWISSDEMIQWGQKSTPPPPILLIYIFSHHERLHCFDTVKSPYFNQATQKNSLIDHPLACLLKFEVLLLGPVTRWAKFHLG